MRNRDLWVGIVPEFLTSTVCFDIFIGCVHFYVGVLHPRLKQNRLTNCKSCLDTFSPLFTTCYKKSCSLPLRPLLCWTQLSAWRNQQLAGGGGLGMIPFMTSQRVYFPNHMHEDRLPEKFHFKGRIK